MVNKYICPVCGYWLDDPPSDFNICPSCGTEFGYHDRNASLESLRAAWLRGGAKWWSTVDPVPLGWDGFTQVSELLTKRPIWDVMMGPRFGFSEKISSGMAFLISHGDGNTADPIDVMNSMGNGSQLGHSLAANSTWT